MTLEKLIEHLKKGNLQAKVLVETSTGEVELIDDIEHHKNYTTLYCRYDFCDVAGDCYELEQQEENKMTDLAEQWKKGELPAGWYYIKIADIVFIDFFEGKVWKNKKDEYIDEVLAPLPSYDEWQETLQALDAAHKAIKMEDETINRLVRSGKQCNYENAKLKELLKECKHIMSIEKDFASCHFEKDKLCKLLTQINQALGEDK